MRRLANGVILPKRLLEVAHALINVILPEFELMGLLVYLRVFARFQPRLSLVVNLPELHPLLTAGISIHFGRAEPSSHPLPAVNQLIRLQLSSSDEIRNTLSRNAQDAGDLRQQQNAVLMSRIFQVIHPHGRKWPVRIIEAHRALSASALS